MCAQVILGYGRVQSVRQMYTSFSWEAEGALEVAFDLRQAFVVTLWRNRTSNAPSGVYSGCETAYFSTT